MLAWLCLVGWLLFVTVVIYALAFIGGFMDALSGLWGGGLRKTNQSYTNLLVGAIWIISIVLKVSIWGWW